MTLVSTSYFIISSLAAAMACAARSASVSAMGGAFFSWTLGLLGTLDSIMPSFRRRARASIISIFEAERSSGFCWDGLGGFCPNPNSGFYSAILMNCLFSKLVKEPPWPLARRVPSFFMVDNRAMVPISTELLRIPAIRFFLVSETACLFYPVYNRVYLFVCRLISLLLMI